MKQEIREVLDDGLGYMKRVQKNLPLLTDAIASSDEHAIKENYGHLKEGLEWLSDAIDNFEHFLKIDYSEILICKESSVKIIGKYKSYIGELDQLFTEGKYKEVAAKVEKDVPKHLKKLTSVFNKVKSIMKESEH